MIKPHTYGYIKEQFEKEGWELVSKEYKNNRTKLEAICKKEHSCWISFSDFQQGKRCKKCATKINATQRRHTYVYIKNYINITGEILKSTEYKNNNTKLEIGCQICHKDYWKTFDHFQRGQRCVECSGKKKYTYEYVKECFEVAEWKLLSKEYKDNRTKLKAICKMGHIVWITFYHFISRRQRCAECWKLKITGKNCNFWKNGITKKNIPLYDTYAHQINFCEEVGRDPKNPDYLQIRCTYCENWFTPTLIEVRTRIAALKGKVRGENRFYCSTECKQDCPIFGQEKYPKGFKKESNRDSSLQKEWADKVKERDNYTCIKCGRKDLPLVAHHIEGLNVNPIESADIDLGITVCLECDKLIHSEIGCRPIDLTKGQLCNQR